MGKLILFELRKLFRSRYFYVITIISVVFVLLTGVTSLIALNIVKNSGDTIPPELGLNVTAYAFTKGALGGTYSMLIGIFVAIAATEDNALGTMKNIIGKGYSRLKVFTAKYITSFIGILVMSIITVAVSLGFGLAVFEKGGVGNDNVAIIILGQFFGLLAYHAIYYAVSTGFGKIGPAIAVSLIGPMGMTLVLTLVDTAIRNDNFKVSPYWVSALYNNFTGFTDPNIYGRCFGLLIAYFAVALVVGFLINRRREY